MIKEVSLPVRAESGTQTNEINFLNSEANDISSRSRINRLCCSDRTLEIISNVLLGAIGVLIVSLIIFGTVETRNCTALITVGSFIALIIICWVTSRLVRCRN
ncbi:hypothetical protein TNCT_585061 [Trichonephila clavata]|uniref:Uncharacterized protein n=1 Tax=Trichonephila clavata TaxID=2740835 RepID=A0A8X6JGF9_TRICU|nr:hypothetical protein TNCT_585061 [Trichonephila clavata]